MLTRCGDVHRAYIAANYRALKNPDEPIVERFEEGHPNHEVQTFEHYYGDAPRRLAWVAAFRIEQNYGGPEEGGWWYDSETVLATIPVMSEARALAAIELLESYYAETEGDLPRTSVASKEGDVQVRFCLTPPADSPAERPHYE